jgi:hypothetical protein
VKKILFTLGVLFLFASCKKEATELPAPSATGANTFGASVNGKMWIPKGFGIVPTAPILQARYQLNGSILINARNFASSPKESEFEIFLKEPITPGVYLLNDDSGNYAYYVERRLTPTGEWRTGGQHTGRVTVSVADTTNDILAGTFEFTAGSLSIYGDAPLNVINGRFDLKVQ